MEVVTKWTMDGRQACGEILRQAEPQQFARPEKARETESDLVAVPTQAIGEAAAFSPPLAKL